jgi:phage gpG-like protein
MKEVRAEDMPQEMAEMAQRLIGESLEGCLRDEVLPTIREGFRENFARAAGPTGSQWPARKDKKGHPLLQETGALLGATQGAAGQVAEVSERFLGVGVDKGVDLGGIPGAAVHNFSYPARNIPQREYLYASEDTLDRATELLADGAYTTIFVF